MKESKTGTNVNRVLKNKPLSDLEVGGDLVENTGVPIDARVSLVPHDLNLLLKLTNALNGIIQLALRAE